MAAYNRTRYVEQLLEKAEYLPPSFTVHLHLEYWVLNNGSKFLYHNPIASLLDDIRAHRIPVDFLEFFDSARVPFYDGCMIVELLDYRPQRSTEPALKIPSKTRVVLHPSPETLWADICSLNSRTGGKWTDLDALEVESKLLLATSQPLCLDPDPHLTRIVNNVLRVSTPSMPLSLKRKASAMEPEEDGPEKARKERLLGFMAPRDNRAHAPSYRLLDAITTGKQKADSQRNASMVQQSTNPYVPPATSQPTPHSQPPPTPTPSTPAPLSAPSPVPNGDNKPVVQPVAARTPVPIVTQPTQPPGYPVLQSKDVIGNQALTPAEQLQKQKHIGEFQQHYMQHQYQIQQQQHDHTQFPQHQSPPAQQSQQLPRPPSQPQQPQRSNTPAQVHPSPQPSAQLPNVQQVPPQRFVLTPKPIQPSTSHSGQSNGTQQYQATAPTFSSPGHLPIQPHGLSAQQMATWYRQVQHRPQQQSTTQPMPNGQIAAQASQHQQLAAQQQAMITRMASNPASGGRSTPLQIQQSPRTQTQNLQQGRAISATPSPVKGSPIVIQQPLAPTNQVRASPMVSQATIPVQNAQNGGIGPAAVMSQGQPGQHPINGQQQAPSNPAGIQQRAQFPTMYNPSQLRPQIHGNTMVQNVSPAPTQTHGTPTMTRASPLMGSAGPVATSVSGPDGKPQLGVQPRGPTPLQQVHMAQMQMQGQAKQGQPSMMQPQPPGGQGAVQAQRVPTPSGQVHQTPVQQPVQMSVANGTAQQQQQPINAQQFQQLAGSAPMPNWPPQVQQQIYRMAQQIHVAQGGVHGQVSQAAIVAALRQYQQQQQQSQAAIQQYHSQAQQGNALQQQQQHIATANQLHNQDQVQQYLRRGLIQGGSNPQMQALAQKRLIAEAQAQAQAQGGQPSAGGTPAHAAFQQVKPGLTPAQQQLMMGKLQMGQTLHPQQQAALVAHQQAMAQNAMNMNMGGGQQLGVAGMGGQPQNMAQMQRMQQFAAQAQKTKAAAAAGGANVLGNMMGGGVGPR